ncbi:hypothetical protein [Streptomyces graminilatus]|uniref:hypothetical protein n=1 Tax=Streptomyces graminilatus TaxID=1464070 RepID=UPI000A7F9983|nr:hypothetical protein [Streptomyces graminilatus]
MDHNCASLVIVQLRSVKLYRRGESTGFVGYNNFFDADGTVIGYGEYISHGDRYTCYTYQRPRD